MKIFICILISTLLINCTGVKPKPAVKNSNTFELFYHEYYNTDGFNSAKVYMYIGEYDIYDREDTIFLLKKAMQYAKVQLNANNGLAVETINFINGKKHFDEDPRYRHWNDIRKDVLFQVNFDIDSLENHHYHISKIIYKPA